MYVTRLCGAAFTAGALALAAAATPAAAYELDRVWVKSWSTSGDADLPAPPKLATPGPGPAAPHPGRNTGGNDTIKSGFGNDLMPPAPTGPSSLALQPSLLAKPKSLKAK